MSEAGARGPQVDASENLYRFITTRSLWVVGENRPSSAAFDQPPPISVNVASLTTVEESTRQLREDLRKPLGGIISVGCGRPVGFHTAGAAIPLIVRPRRGRYRAAR